MEGVAFLISQLCLSHTTAPSSHPLHLFFSPSSAPPLLSSSVLLFIPPSPPPPRPPSLSPPSHQHRLWGVEAKEACTHTHCHTQIGGHPILRTLKQSHAHTPRVIQAPFGQGHVRTRLTHTYKCPDLHTYTHRRHYE